MILVKLRYLMDNDLATKKNYTAYFMKLATPIHGEFKTA